MEFLQIVLLGLFAVAGTGTCFTVSQNRTDQKTEIQGGAPICIDKVPYQIHLRNYGTEYFCGGVLIRPNIVLTAAHCVTESIDLKLQLVAVAGTDRTKNNVFDSSVTLLAEKIQVHPKYDKKIMTNSLNYDLAVIKLNKEFPLTNRIKPIELAKRDVKENDVLILTGIGLVDEKIDKMSPCLKYYLPKVMKCNKLLPHLNVLHFNGAICHKSYIGDRSLPGDSGSPMADSEGKLAAIHIGSFKQCQVGINVFHYTNWIEQTVNEFKK